ncbi:helix-turn-helix domain-containing protein [Brachybacterium kimchii]|uniref:Helix-turn-helix domain-containing protein n=1 Tax=Brachybacterium kimchii TaxID=2942909 RepID=A0ABY4N7T9_9MICO|nr:helix-turn-helix domain-containing protein [Brachybacterium kimchii]UQN30621.1 helix-turn-helix domain-containing protein [Brachybacterium kimchii]
MPSNQLISAALRLFRPEPPMRAADAAEMLGVTVGRIRQYADSGELDRADVGGRDLFVTAASVRRRLARTRNRDRRTTSTLALSEIPQAPSSLPTAYDRLATGFPNPSGTLREDPVHLRAWIDEDNYAVVLVASATDTYYSGLLDSSATETAAAIFTLIPQLEPSRTVLLALERDPFQGTDAYVLMESVLTVKTGPTSPRVFENPIRNIVHLDSLAERIGHRPTLFHRSAYTPENVEAYTRTGRPVTVPWDPDEHLTREANLHALEAYDGPAARLIRDLLLDGSRLMSNRPTSISSTGELDGLTYPWAPQGSVLRRQHASAATLDEIQSRFADEPDGLRFTPSQAEEAYQLLAQTANDAEQFGRSPDPLIERLAASALPGVVPRTDIDMEDFGQLLRHLEDRYPLHPIVERTFDALAADDVMTEYVDAFTPHEGASDLGPHEREHLSHATRYWNDPDKLIGRDAFGRPAVLSSQPGRRRLLVLEDTQDAPKIRASDEIVSGALGDNINDVPLFVRRAGNLIGIVPVSPHGRTGHHLGYAGGAPADAAADLGRALQGSGFPAEEADSPTLEQVTTDASLRAAGRLQIPVKSLLANSSS